MQVFFKKNYCHFNFTNLILLNSFIIKLLSVTLHGNKIKEIMFPETFSVRRCVLREGKPVKSCFFEGDGLTTTNILGFLLIKK